MDDAILYMSDELKLKAFERNWAKLDTSTAHLDVDALRLCVRLLPQTRPDESSEPREKLRDLLLRRLLDESEEPEYLYQLAEASALDEAFAGQFFLAVHAHLERAAESLNAPNRSDDFQDARQTDELDGRAQDEPEQAVSTHQQTAAYLRFLKYSFWLPPQSLHVLQPSLPGTLLAFVGVEDFSDVALDALSALLSLLRCASQEPVCIVDPGYEVPWLQSDPVLNRLVLRGPIIDQSFWTVFRALKSAQFESKSSKLFKVWFQWISQAVVDGFDPDGIYEDLYWDLVRTGMLNGFADQRKYCLGIIRASLLVAHRDINTRSMRLEVDKKDIYIKAYDRYFVLYETVVLDRYANQIEASLSELSALFGSKSVVTASMATALLSSGLDPQVQEGIRKIVGNWYFGFISGSQSPLSRDSSSLAEHTGFLAHAFLPWATQGGLFISTLKTARTGTECVHGAALVDTIAHFTASTFSDQAYRENLLVLVLNFVLGAGGKMFQMSTLYLLEGLIRGYDRVAQAGGSTQLSSRTIETILRISRTPGLPEIAGDLYKVYCKRLCDFAVTDLSLDTIPGHSALAARNEELRSLPTTSESQPALLSTTGTITSLSAFLQTLQDSKHASIQGAAYATACNQLVAYFNNVDISLINPDELHAVLDAMWEEADRREFNRSVAVHLPELLFHTKCIQTCLAQQANTPSEVMRDGLAALLTKAATTLQQLSEGRSYILASFANSLRKAAFTEPSIIEVLPYEDIIIRFFNHPPAAKVEFLFEVAAAEKLQHYIPHRSYASYYGQREWHAYAAWIDLLNRFPKQQHHVARRVFDRLLEPWAGQKGTIPVISKWKDVFQLQAMLVLIEHRIFEADVDTYLDKFMHALTVEQWPRFRFVLEWIITRIYFHYPGKSNRILEDLAHLDESSPIHIASLMKLAVLAAPFLHSEDFAMDLITQLIPFSASQKVHIRHEAHLSFPVVFELAEKKNWTTITSNPGFSILNTHIRQTEKFKTPAWSIRTLRIDAVADFTLTEIFQGQYLYIESPEQERVAHEDFIALWDADGSSVIGPAQQIMLGEPRTQTDIPVNPKPVPYVLDEDGVKSNFYQTKSGFDFNSLLPPAGTPHLRAKQPASVVLIASLIDNPTNLGGLSRISESFGLETLYINDIKKTTHKDFKATSVTSEKHLPIKELREPDVPAFITSMKTKGYKVVGIEQTDRSGMLGDEVAGDAKDIGTLPRRCVLVLGAEKSGITPEVLSVVDRCVEIRTVGVTRSLNVQTAGGIAVYEWWREWNGKIQM